MPEMPGAFGLAECFRGDQVDTSALVESHPMLSVHQLHRERLLVPGAEVQIKDGGYFRALAGGGKVEINGQQIRVAWHPALPLRVFICRCGRDAYKIHSVGGVWACRKCHSLIYSSRSRRRTIKGLNRIIWLRKRLNADPAPFSPLPGKPLHARSHWRLVREIRQLEAALLEHTRRDVAEVLERRHARS